MADDGSKKILQEAVIKNIDIHSSYIPALQSMLLYYIDQVLPKATDLNGIFLKFKEMQEEIGPKKKPEVDLQWYEHHVYILWSLLQIFGYHANEQNLYQDSNVEIDNELLGSLTKAILDGDKDAQKNLYNEFFNDIQKQIKDDNKSS